MAALKPTFVDKEDFKFSPLDEKFKGTADSWNQLKNAAIDHADLLDGIEGEILILEQDIAINAQAIFDLGVEVDTKVQSVTGPTVDNSDPLNPFIPAGTTAGVLGSLYLTGDETILAAGTFYNTNIEGKGTVASVQQVVVAPDDTREYFLQDLIGIPFISDGDSASGRYNGWLSVLLSTVTSEKQKFGIEVYRADADGNVIASGVPGAVVGSYGVTVIAIADSGEIELVNGNETQINISAILNDAAPHLAGERIRYRVFAEKVGAIGGNVTLSVFYGINHNSYIELPVLITTDSVVNLSGIPGIRQTEVNNFIYNNDVLRAPNSTPAAIKTEGEKAAITKEYLNRADQDPTTQASISGALSFDMLRSVQDAILTGNITSIAFTNEPGVNDRVSALLNVWQNGTGGFTIDWVGSGVYAEDGKTASDFQPLGTANSLTQYWLNWTGSFWVISLIKVSISAL